MRRDPALVPLSHDHHHALVRARRLRKAAAGEGDLARETAAFVHGFLRESVPHFRDEEERLFPLALLHAPEREELVAELVLEHVRLHALVARLAAGDAGAAAEAGELLELHVRREERELFPALEECVPPAALAALALDEREASPEPPAIDLLHAPGDRGPLWGTATEDLNATLLEWPPGTGQPERANPHRDLVFVVVAGGGTATVAGAVHELAPGRALLVEKSTPFAIEAGPGGLRYLSIHLRRPGLEIGRFDG
ncbi:MAG: hemerythrin domain-containing protein [Gaiellaceae bacterium]